MQLVILLIALAALVIGVLSLTSERGAAEILFSQPVSRTTMRSPDACVLKVRLV